MVDYSVIYEGTTNGGKTFHVRLNSEIKRKVLIRIYNTYFMYPEIKLELEMEPGIQYWNYVVSSNSERYAEFRDAETYEIVGLFGLVGDFKYKDFDYDLYAKKIFNLVSGSGKPNIIGLFSEIISQGTYWNEWVDVEENDIVVDIGFNYGLFSTTTMTKKPKKIIGFEPNTKLIKIFNDNYKGGGIEVHNYAISNVDTKLTFYENSDAVMSTIKKDIFTEYRTGETEVEALDINTMIRKFSLDKIDYLKVDCEGSEYDIFDSISEDYLSNNIKKIAIEFHTHLMSVEVQKLISKLKNCGFTVNIKSGDGDRMGMIYAKKIL